MRASCALSIIEQKPVVGGPVALLSYHLRDPKHTITKHPLNPVAEEWRNDLLVKAWENGAERKLKSPLKTPIYLKG